MTHGVALFRLHYGVSSCSSATLSFRKTSGMAEKITGRTINGLIVCCSSEYIH